MIHITRSWFAALTLLTINCLFLVSGCTTYPDTMPAPPPTWLASATWQASGVVSIRTAQRTDTVYVTWQQHGDRLQLSFTSSLGTHIARLNGTPGHTTLIRADGHSQQAANPDQLVKQFLGWSLPVSGLQYWIRGLPAPGPYQHITPTHWQQHGWHIDYQHYRRIDGITLPTRLTLQRHGITLRIIVKKWSISPNQTATPTE